MRIASLNAILASVRGGWSALHPNLRGALWIVAAAFFLSAMAAALKVIGQFMSVWEMLLIRSGIALALLLPALARGRFRAVVTRRPGTHLARGVMGTAAFTMFFLAVTHVDLTLVSALGFTRNLFVIVLALLFLGETLRRRRAAATLVGFLGVVVCLQPDASGFNPWALAALGFALFGAGVTTLVKRLATTEPPVTILFYMYLYMGLVALVPALLTWRQPTLYEFGLVALAASLSTLGQTCMVRALQNAEATAVTPFEYTRILYAFGFGYLLFGEIPALSTWLGGVVIVGSTLYVAYRERSSSKG